MTTLTLLDYIHNDLTANKLAECNLTICRDYLDYPTPELNQLGPYEDILGIIPGKYRNIRLLLKYIIQGVKYNNNIDVYNTPAVLTYIVSAIADQELNVSDCDILRVHAIIPEPPAKYLTAYMELQEIMSKEYPNIKYVLRVIIERLKFTMRHGVPTGKIVFPGPMHVMVAPTEAPTEAPTISALPSVDTPTETIILEEELQEGHFNTQFGVMNAKQFLSNVHKFALNDIIDIVDANKDLFNNEYAEMILSMHTGVPVPARCNNDPISYACYGMLFNVHPKVVAFNLGENSNQIIKKHLPLYISGTFNKKDLLIDIVMSAVSGEQIRHFAKSHFTYVELLEMEGKLYKSSIDFIKLALDASN